MEEPDKTERNFFCRSLDGRYMFEWRFCESESGKPRRSLGENGAVKLVERRVCLHTGRQTGPVLDCSFVHVICLVEKPNV